MACFSALQTLLTRMRLTTVQTLIFSLLLALTSVFSPALRADPVGWQRADEQWLTQTSDHFEIHFLAGYDAMAARARNPWLWSRPVKSASRAASPPNRWVQPFSRQSAPSCPLARQPPAGA